MLKKVLDFYLVLLSFNIIEVLHGEDGELICCGAEMKLFEETTAGQGKEKQVPVIEMMDNSIKIKVGSMPHPMEEKYLIEWAELFDKGRSYRHYLNPGELPETVVKSLKKGVTAREYCNVHGLWMS